VSHELIESVSVGRTLRPARIAFLFDADDPGGARQAISHATSLWGGMYGPLVPVFRQWPEWWSDAEEDVDEIVATYLTSFDPDWIVSLVPGYAPPIMGERQLTLRRSRPMTGFQPAGGDLGAVIDHAHHTRFRFAEHDEPEHVLHDADAECLLGDVLLGHLGEEGHPRRIRRQLVEQIGTTSVTLDVKLLMRAQADVGGARPLVTPLVLGSEGLMLDAAARVDRYLFFCSATRAWDAIELWNLRAAGREVFALPVEWLDDLGEVVEQLFAGDRVHVVAAQRLTTHERETVTRRIGGKRELSGSSSPWGFGVRAASMVAKTDVVTVPVEGGQLEVAPLQPEWADQRWRAADGTWINEVEIHEDVHGRELAGLLPHDLDEAPGLVGHRAGSPAVRVDRGRYLIPYESRGSSVGLSLPTGTAIAQAWLAQRGIDSRVSDPGSTLLEIVRRLQGLRSVRSLLGPSTIRLLDAGTRRRHLERNLVLSALREDGAARPEGRLWQLALHGVLRAGLIVHCPRCRRKNFMLPERLGERMPCERCTEPMRFPDEKPPTQWAYRPIGPFAVENHASGAYPALLATQALLSDHQFGGTWAPSLELDRDSELDFIIWRQPRFALDRSGHPPELILGEAKAYDAFEEVDAQRMLGLRRRLQAGTLCFATMREALRDEDRERLREVAAELARDVDGIAPLIVLTRAELFASSLSTHLERQTDGLDLDDGISPWNAPVERLAQATQALYL
jgi:hypothetical protein